MKTVFEGIDLGFEVISKADSKPLFSQVHSATVLSLDKDTSDTPSNADGAITSKRDLELFVFTADCVPLLFHSKRSNAPECIAAIHAGWKGVRSGIVQETLERLDPAKTAVWVGPSIRGCCYEVKEDLIESFLSAKMDINCALEKREGRWYFDLPSFLLSAPLAAVSTKDSSALRCTYCSSPKLPSYRRNGDTETRLRSWIRFS